LPAQIVLDKTNSDDELIDALKQEIERLKAAIRDLRNNMTSKSDGSNEVKKMTIRSAADSTMVATTTAMNATTENEAVRRLTTEINRLERICKSQVQYANAFTP
jgi:polyhydroxyalkanoate synthesis regulator phasin